MNAYLNFLSEEELKILRKSDKVLRDHIEEINKASKVVDAEIKRIIDPINREIKRATRIHGFKR
ncbi:hypothetical protein F4Y59_12375 [Candidatus Poribacteria bacterium]|nr:hypothetical protein [Candidatus Poribacteria bacterium]